MFRPMLATLGSPTEIDESEDGWSFEMKWDGIRAIATVGTQGVELRTRNGLDITSTYPELAELRQRVSGEAVLDGEIVALNKAGRPDFGLLQRRMKLIRPAEVAAAAASIPVHYLVFDLISLEGTSFTKQSYTDRRSALRSAVRPAGVVQVPTAFEGDLTAAIEASAELDLEGVVAKKRDSTYAEGARSRAWIKIKHHKTQEVVIGGWRPGSGRRAGSIGSLLMGVPDETGLRYVGRVGTGFDDKELIDIAATLSKLVRATTPFIDAPREVARDAKWVSPALVGEVEFAEWTASHHLRQPSWRGWRFDKKPTDVVREG